MFVLKLRVTQALVGMCLYEVVECLGCSYTHLTKINAYKRIASHKLEAALDNFIIRSLGLNAVKEIESLIRQAYQDSKEGVWNG